MGCWFLNKYTLLFASLLYCAANPLMAQSNQTEAARWLAKAALAPVSWRYPRERLLNALALLLWNGEASNEPEIVRHLQRQLSTSAVDWPGFVAAYKQIWPQYG